MEEVALPGAAHAVREPTEAPVHEDADRDELVFAATETLRENAVVGLRLPPSQSLASWVARSGETALVNDVRSDPRFYPDGLHPFAIGFERYANALDEALRR